METFDFAAASAEQAPGAPGLGRELATAAGRAGLVLEAMLRRPVTATSGPLERLRPADVSLDGRCGFAVELGAGPRGVATVPAAFVTGLAEMLMGGPGYETGREPTPLECSVFASRLSAALGPVAAVLPVPELRLVADGTPVTPATELVAFALDLSVGSLTGRLRVALPAAHFTAAGIRATGADPEPDPALMAALRTVLLGMAVRFEPVRLPGDELERLAVGDVVRLAHPVDRPLVAEIDGQPLFLARPGRRGRRLAVEIADVVEETVRKEAGR
jgi:flagellar motor switch protein FliM